MHVYFVFGLVSLKFTLPLPLITNLYFFAVWDSWMPWRPQKDPWGCWRGTKLCYWVDLPSCYFASSHQEYWKVYCIIFLPTNYYSILDSSMAIWKNTAFDQRVSLEGKNWKWRLHIGSCLLRVTLLWENFNGWVLHAFWKPEPVSDQDLWLMFLLLFLLKLKRPMEKKTKTN